MGQWQCRARGVNGTPIPAVELVSTQKIRQLTYIAEEDPLPHPRPPHAASSTTVVVDYCSNFLTQPVWHNRCQDTAAELPQCSGQNYRLQTNRFQWQTRFFTDPNFNFKAFVNVCSLISVPYCKAAVLLQPLLTQHIQHPRRQKITDHTDNM